MWNFQGLKLFFPSARFCAFGIRVHAFLVHQFHHTKSCKSHLGVCSLQSHLTSPAQKSWTFGCLKAQENHMEVQMLVAATVISFVFMICNAWAVLYNLIMSCYTWDLYTSAQVCQEREARTEMPWHVWSAFYSVCCLKDMYALAWAWISFLIARSAANRCSAKIFSVPQKTSTARRCIDGRVKKGKCSVMVNDNASIVHCFLGVRKIFQQETQKYHHHDWSTNLDAPVNKTLFLGGATSHHITSSLLPSASLEPTCWRAGTATPAAMCWSVMCLGEKDHGNLRVFSTQSRK